MLELTNVTAGYGSITALRGVSIQVEDGAIVTLVGANGAGKSTTLRAVSGLIKVREGTITYRGKPWPTGHHTKLWRAESPMCPKDGWFFPT